MAPSGLTWRQWLDWNKHRLGGLIVFWLAVFAIMKWPWLMVLLGFAAVNAALWWLLAP